MTLPVASISSKRLSLVLFTTRLTSSSSLSSSESPRMNRDFFFCVGSSSDISLSSSSDDSESELLESLPAVRRNLDMAGLAAAFGAAASSSPLVRSSSSDSSVSESESPACLKNRDMIAQYKIRVQHPDISPMKIHIRLLPDAETPPWYPIGTYVPRLINNLGKAPESTLTTALICPRLTYSHSSMGRLLGMRIKTKLSQSHFTSTRK
jgi:hypothetical protein